MGKMSPEEEKEESNKGFDTQASKTKKMKIFVTGFIILVLISLGLGITGTGKKIQDAIIHGGSSTYSGQVRNCILSVFGHPIDCSPNATGQCLPTMINGHAPDCGSFSGDDRDCPLVTVERAQHNPYRYCYSIGGKDNLCIPCQYGDH